MGSIDLIRPVLLFCLLGFDWFEFDCSFGLPWIIKLVDRPISQTKKFLIFYITFLYHKAKERALIPCQFQPDSMLPFSVQWKFAHSIIPAFKKLKNNIIISNVKAKFVIFLYVLDLLTALSNNYDLKFSCKNALYATLDIFSWTEIL